MIGVIAGFMVSYLPDAGELPMHNTWVKDSSPVFVGQLTGKTVRGINENPPTLILYYKIALIATLIVPYCRLYAYFSSLFFA